MAEYNVWENVPLGISMMICGILILGNEFIYLPRKRKKGNFKTNGRRWIYKIGGIALTLYGLLTLFGFV